MNHMMEMNFLLCLLSEKVVVLPYQDLQLPLGSQLPTKTCLLIFLWPWLSLFHNKTAMPGSFSHKTWLAGSYTAPISSPAPQGLSSWTRRRPRPQPTGWHCGSSYHWGCPSKTDRAFSMPALQRTQQLRVWCAHIIIICQVNYALKK